MFSKKRKILFGIVFFFAGGLVYLLLFSSWAQVNVVSVEGLSAVSAEDIERVVREEMAEHVLRVFPKSASILFPEKHITDVLRTSFPRIKNIYIAAQFPKEVTVHIEDRQVEGVWCGAGTCAFFDSTGTIFENAPQTTRGFLLFQIADERARDAVPTLGDRVLGEDMLSFVLFLREGMMLRELPAVRYTIINDEEVHVAFRDGWDAYFLREHNPIYQVEVLDRVLEKEIGDNVPLLDYVDLRVKNKVFYSFE